MKFATYRQKYPAFEVGTNKSTSVWFENSIYFLWFEYLKRSQAYIETCQNNGHGICQELYKDFGDIRGDFKEWWQSRGEYLFAEPPQNDVIRVLKEGELPSTDKSVLTVSIPLYYEKYKINRFIEKLLAKHHPEKTARDLLKSSQARYKVSTMQSIDTLKKGLRVYDYKIANPNKKRWEVAIKTLPVSKAQMPHEKDTAQILADKKHVLDKIVGRYLKNVRTAINNAEKGTFP